MATKGTHQPPETLSKESFGVIEQVTSGMFDIVWLAGWPKRTEASRASARHCCVPNSTDAAFDMCTVLAAAISDWPFDSEYSSLVAAPRIGV